MICKSLEYFLPSFGSFGLSVLEKKLKIDFQDGGVVAILISDLNEFSFFYLQVTLKLPFKFRVNWPFVSEEEIQNRLAAILDV